MNELNVVFSSVFPDKTDSENFNKRTAGVGSVAVVICNKNTFVYDTDGVEDVDKAVASMVYGMTICCNYKYEFKKKIGNVYWYD